MSRGGRDALNLFDASAPEESRSSEVWTVSDLNRAVRGLLEGGLSALWVQGEVANWTRARSGHRYFTLKDDRAQLRCVMWRRDAARLPADPEEGMRVRAFGSPTLYEARGEYQLSVRRLEGEGEEGLWRLAFERLRSRLQEEGLLDPARKRALPRIPRSVGVVTSPTGAALRDILSVIGRRAPWTRVVIRGTRVQGEGSAHEIAAAIELLGKSGEVDVIVVGRGGGSIEDLWAFNEEPVARAIASCPVPVVSAVGHEVDVTISDLVADLRAPTPSAAGEAVVPDGTSLLALLASARPRLVRALRSGTEGRRNQIEEARGRLERGMTQVVEPGRVGLERRRDRLAPAWRSIFAPAAVRVDSGAERLTSAVRAIVRRRGERLGSLAGQVNALSPLSTLRRGYAIPLGPGDVVLRRASEFREAAEFQLRVVDGRIRCETKSVEEEGR